MDLLSHALYGVTACSRTGLAGGRRGSPASRWYRDSTLWWALLFGLLPDMLSMWLPFAAHTLSDSTENFFHWFGEPWLTVYRGTHSLVIALAVSGLIWGVRRELFVPSLAWAVHVLLDAVSHGEGKFQNLPLYPFGSWGVDGIDWWRTPWLIFAVWGALPLCWFSLTWWRRGASNRTETCRLPSQSITVSDQPKAGGVSLRVPKVGRDRKRGPRCETGLPS